MRRWASASQARKRASMRCSTGKLSSCGRRAQERESGLAQVCTGPLTPPFENARMCTLTHKAHSTGKAGPVPAGSHTCRHSLSAAASMPSSSSACTKFAYVMPSRPTVRMNAACASKSCPAFTTLRAAGGERGGGRGEDGSWLRWAQLAQAGGRSGVRWRRRHTRLAGHNGPAKNHSEPQGSGARAAGSPVQPAVQFFITWQDVALLQQAHCLCKGKGEEGPGYRAAAF